MTHRTEIINIIILISQEFLESFSSSDSDDEEWEEIRIHNKRRRVIPRINNYVENIIPSLDTYQFQSHFRMRRETFDFILSIIGPRLKRTYKGCPMLTPQKQFLIAIWRMATPDCYRSICEKFGVSRSTALYATVRVAKVLTNMAPVFIKWPRGRDVQAVWAGFETISGFPKVLGAIDGTHINIPAPRLNPESYVNRKGHHSLQLQAVCDHKTRFIHCYTGQAGSVHDYRVFRLSEMNDALGNHAKFPDDCHLLGDSAYKLHDNLLTPYRDNGHLTEREKNYNFCHSSARMAIERAFGLLKNRFRSLLTVLPMYRIQSIPSFIMACCVLHNICLLKGDELQEATLIDDANEYPHAAIAEGIQQGVAKRDLICERLPLRMV